MIQLYIISDEIIQQIQKATIPIISDFPGYPKSFLWLLWAMEKQGSRESVVDFLLEITL